jgi:adenine-specific DNA methylase
LFGGSCTVSYLLKKMGKAVTYNDSLRFNWIIGKALIQNDSVVLSADEVNSLLQPGRHNHEGFVARTFKGMYFTAPENRWIDAICSRIADMEETPGADMKAAIARYALFQSCLVKRPFNLFHRKNLYLRRARVERTFGNKTTWDRPFNHHFRTFAAEANLLVFEGGSACHATNVDASIYPAANYDLLYLDPPYLRKGATQETADYHRCYHFLEGLANYRRWGDMVDLATTNRRLKAERSNDWCDAERSGGALDALLGKFPESIVAISYRKFGTPSLSTLVRLLRRHGRRVETFTKHYKYALNHQNGDAQFNREALIIGTRR